VIHHTLRGIHRAHGRPARRSAALATPEIKRLVATCRTRSLADLRDCALLLLGYQPVEKAVGQPRWSGAMLKATAAV
jgi:hypothetical protein